VSRQRQRLPRRACRVDKVVLRVLQAVEVADAMIEPGSEAVTRQWERSNLLAQSSNALAVQCCDASKGKRASTQKHGSGQLPVQFKREVCLALQINKYVRTD